MKTISKFINEKLSALDNCITEKLKIKSSSKKETIIANDKKHLQQIISAELNTNGTHLDLRHIDVSSVKSFSALFNINYNNDFKNIQSIDITGWDVSNVRNAGCMFIHLQELEEIFGFGDLDFKNNETFDNCFYECTKLQYIENIENLKLYPSCDFISGMFSKCYNITELNLNNWDVSNVEDFDEMFMDSGLVNLHIDKWNMSDAYDVSYMFSGCNNLISLDLSNWDMRYVKKCNNMFAYCENLKTIGNIDKWNLKNCNNYSHMFFDCKNLKLDIRKWLINDKAKKISMFDGTKIK